MLLVHGAFTETTTWAGVVGELRRRAVDAVALPTPLGGLRTDAAYVASRAAGVDGAVLLVGEGYGGAVVSAAAAGAPNVRGLVLVAAFAPDEGESCIDLLRASGDVRGLDALLPTVVRHGEGPATVEASIRCDAYPELVAGDLAEEDARTAAATQRAVLTAALEEPAPPPAWRTLPSWFVVAGGDRLVAPSAQRAMAERAGAEITELDASHAVARSRSADVADVIARAAACVAR